MSIPDSYLQALVDVSQEINSIVELDALLERILSIAIEQLSAERGFILLKSEVDGEMTPRAARNLDPQKAEDVSQISSTALDSVISKKKPILTFDTASDAQFDTAPSIELHKIRSIACVPILLRGSLVGVIYIDSQEQTASFTKSSLSFLSAFANQAAIAIENARLLASLRDENTILKEEFHRIYAFDEIVGKSKAMKEAFSLVGKVLNNSSTVLITGETGTGKELFARAIHYNGIRKDHPFVPVNCAAISESLIESELYGYKKGAFTGALADKRGLIEMAHGGTLFLDEIGEIPMNIQVKLLRFLQEKEVLPVGGHQPVKVDVRLVAATHRNLEEEVREGRFREDLYYRLKVIPLYVPPLRERISDIPLLAGHFLKRCAAEFGKELSGFTPDALSYLGSYSWPGNVRELQNVIERAAVLTGDVLISRKEIVLKELRDVRGIEPGMTMDGVLQALLQKTLRACDGNKTRTAEMMDVSVRWVHYKSKEWGIEVK